MCFFSSSFLFTVFVSFFSALISFSLLSKHNLTTNTIVPSSHVKYDSSFIAVNCSYVKRPDSKTASSSVEKAFPSALSILVATELFAPCRLFSLILSQYRLDLHCSVGAFLQEVSESLQHPRQIRFYVFKMNVLSKPQLRTVQYGKLPS